MVDLIGLILPLAYLSILIGTLATFSNLYRKRKQVRAISLEPWFPTHLQKNIYLSLLHLEDVSTSEPKATVPDSILRAALLRRAVEDIHRILQIRNSKQALSSLQQRGSVGDDLWQRFTRAEQETEIEIRDVVNEANALSPNWGQTIFQTANEMAANVIVREKVAGLQGKIAEEKEQWEQRRQSVREEFLKELDGDKPAIAPSPEVEKKKKKITAPETAIVSEGRSSDEDAVPVNGGISTASGAFHTPGGSTPGTPGASRTTSGKKKKGKK